jgi:glycosyltransferase involved in cell wall biosynthesis
MNEIFEDADTPRALAPVIPRMIFHVPWEIDVAGRSASSIRPLKMLQAFRELGYDIFVISGSGKERAARFAELKRALKGGLAVRFMYSESSTLPTLWASGKRDLMRFPAVDYRVFLLCKRHKIPIGIFYRDIYWRFPQLLKVTPRIRAWAFQLGYRLDLKLYQYTAHTIFLPSMTMRRYFSVPSRPRIVPLPSGLDRDQGTSLATPDKGESPRKLKIAYVGGFGGHYQMDKLLRVAKRLCNEVELGICCRQEEWLAATSQHALVDAIVSVVHLSASDAASWLRGADICSLFVEPSSYWAFAMPMKLFTYLAAECPILASEGTEAGRFVQANDLGWVLSYEEDDLEALLRELLANPARVTARRKVAQAKAGLHTWRRRAEAVEEALGLEGR